MSIHMKVALTSFLCLVFNTSAIYSQSLYYKIWAVDMVHITAEFASERNPWKKLELFREARNILHRQGLLDGGATPADPEERDARHLTLHLYALQAFYLLDEDTLETIGADSVTLGFSGELPQLPETVDNEIVAAFRDSLYVNHQSIVTLDLNRIEINLLLKAPPGKRPFTAERNTVLLNRALVRATDQNRIPMKLILSPGEVGLLGVPLPEPGNGIWTPFVWLWRKIVSIF